MQRLAGVSDVRTEAGLMKRKPNCIDDYNKYMGGVDLSNRKIYHVSAERPTRRYWKNIFFNLVDMALLNTYELYRANTDAAQYKSRHDYLCAVVESLCGVEEPRLEMEAARAPAQAAQQFEGHMLQHLPGRQERDCAVSSYRSGGIRTRSSHYFTGCGSGVHKLCFDSMTHNHDQNRGAVGQLGPSALPAMLPSPLPAVLPREDRTALEASVAHLGRDSAKAIIKLVAQKLLTGLELETHTLTGKSGEYEELVLLARRTPIARQDTIYDAVGQPGPSALPAPLPSPLPAVLPREDRTAFEASVSHLGCDSTKAIIKLVAQKLFTGQVLETPCTSLASVPLSPGRWCVLRSTACG